MAGRSSLTWEPYKLSDERTYVPAIGLGTHKVHDRDTILRVVDVALAAGYRSFDTAAVNRNEVFLGEAFKKYLPKYELTREDIFITSKTHNANHSNKKRIRDIYKKCCEALETEPDLYLIHFPKSISSKKNIKYNYEAWGGLVDIFNDGQLAAIGVSNFTIAQLEDLKREYRGDVPLLNQVEWNPMSHDEELLKYCNANAILLQGYKSLGGHKHRKNLFENAIIKKMAEDHCVKPAQILFTWSLQKGVPVIPNSINAREISENIDLTFRLPHDSMKRLQYIKWCY